MPERGRLILYAPNVHTGGGLVLLQALLDAWPDDEPLLAWLDARARPVLKCPSTARLNWVRATVFSRLAAEHSLGRLAEKRDTVLCFHGLPPLRRTASRIWLFQQNRIHLGQVPLAAYGWKTRNRLRLERLISRVLRRRVARYLVQTPSMAKALREWHGADPADIQVLPFVPLASTLPKIEGARSWDFIYVADGEAHKNHRALIDAWIILARQGLTPSLALTLSSRDRDLKAWVEGRVSAFSLNIIDLGHVPHRKALELYASARALIFPSIAESFGLPLLEARNAGLPILAGELDFVRDVCEPAETFDPSSPVSIARSVKRFLGEPEPRCEPVSASAFLDALMKEV